MSRRGRGAVAAFAIVTTVAAGCGGQYFFRWNARDFARETEDGHLVAQTSDRETTPATQSLSDGSYVRLVVDQVCFPEDPDRVLGTMFNPDAARMSFILFATNEHRDIWRDVERMTGHGGQAEREREEQLQKYRVFPHLHYVSRGSCVNRRIATDWLPVDDATQMPRVAFTGMVLHEEEFQRLSDDAQRILDITDSVAQGETEGVTRRIRGALDTTGEVLSVIQPNRHIIWFMQDLEDLAVEVDDGRAVVSEPVTVMFSEPIQASDEGSGDRADERFSANDVSDLFVQGRVRYEGARVRVQGEEGEIQYPEPYVRMHVEVSPSRPTSDFWTAMTRVLEPISRGRDFGDAEQTLDQLQESYNIDQQSEHATMTSASMRSLSRQQAQYLQTWMRFAENSIESQYTDCPVLVEGFGLLTDRARGQRWGAPRDAFDYVDRIVKDRLERARNIEGCQDMLALHQVCADARTVQPGNEPEQWSGSFDHSSPIDVRGNGGERPDMFYRIDVPAEGRLWVTVRPESTGFRPSIGLLRGCSEEFLISEPRLLGEGERRWASFVQSVEPGSYYLVVENQNAGSRETPSFRLGVDFLPDGSGRQMVASDTLRLGREIRGRVNWWDAGRTEDSFCGVDSREIRGNRQYFVDVEAEGRYQVAVSGQHFDGVVSLWSMSDRAQLDCDQGAAPGLSIERDLTPGRYLVSVSQRIPNVRGDEYKVVMREGGGAGPSRPDPNPSVCGDAQPLPIDASRVVELPASEGNIMPSRCGDDVGFGTEQVFSVDVPASGRYVFAANGVGGSDPVLYLRRECQNGSTELLCNDDADLEGRSAWGAPLSDYGSAFQATLEAGRYALVVDTYGTGGGQVEVGWRRAQQRSVIRSQAVVCREAQTLQMNAATVVTVPSQEGGMTPVDCGLESAGMGSEVAFRVQVPVAGEYVFSAAGGEGADPVMYLRGDCSDASSQLACNDDASETLRTQLGEGFPDLGSGFQARLEPGSYTLVVDTYGLNGGDVRVRWFPEGGGTATVVQDRRSGNLCDGPPALALGSSTNIDLPSAAGQTAPTQCGLDAAGAGSETTFQIQVASAGQYTFWAAGQGSADPVLYLRRSCADASSQVICNDDADETVRASLPAMSRLSSGFTAELQPGTYTLVADTYGTEGGAISVGWRAAGSGGGGGATTGGGGAGGGAALCDSVPTLPAGTTRTVTVASADGRTAPTECGLDDAGKGDERAFTVRVTSPGDYVFYSNGVGTADPVLYLRRSCADASSQLVCNDDADQALRRHMPSLSRLGSGFRVTLQPGEYTLVADTYGNEGGQLQVQWGPAP